VRLNLPRHVKWDGDRSFGISPLLASLQGEDLKEHRMADVVTAREEHMGVRSRISWGAIMAGAVVSIAVYLVMTLFGAAIGLGVRDGTESVGAGAAIWAVFTTAVSLFAGGWVAARTVVGETTGEAVIHAIIMWGVVMAMIMWLVAAGARAGFSAMIGFSQFSDSTGRSASVDDMRQRVNSAVAQTEAATQDPTARQAFLDRAKEATWWTLLGTLASMAAAVAGGFFGGGTALRMLPRDIRTVGTPAVRGV
jgi:hypothetical protein